MDDILYNGEIINHTLEFEMHVTLNLRSGNRKVGPIPVSTTEADSCPNECPLKGTDCYARFGPLGMHWRKIGPDGRGTQWDFFCRAISKFLPGQLWRHNQAGDLPQTEDGKIDAVKCGQLSKASQHTKGWTYTHYDPTDEDNAVVIDSMNRAGGMTVNLSADSLDEADNYAALDIGPVCVILPKDSPTMGNKTPKGLPIVTCPAQTNENMSCDECRLCQVRDRKSIVGFLAHGTASKRLSTKLAGEMAQA
jgi:hypothetical protein